MVNQVHVLTSLPPFPNTNEVAKERVATLSILYFLNAFRVPGLGQGAKIILSPIWKENQGERMWYRLSGWMGWPR